MKICKILKIKAFKDKEKKCRIMMLNCSCFLNLDSPISTPLLTTRSIVIPEVLCDFQKKKNILQCQVLQGFENSMTRVIITIWSWIIISFGFKYQPYWKIKVSIIWLVFSKNFSVTTMIIFLCLEHYVCSTHNVWEYITPIRD